MDLAPAVTPIAPPDTPPTEASAHERAVLEDHYRQERRAIAEAMPTVARAVRDALQILTLAPIGLEPGQRVLFRREDLARVQQLLHAALEADACREAILAQLARRADDVTPTTDERVYVQRFVDALDERPHEVGVQFLALEHRVARLERALRAGGAR